MSNFLYRQEDISINNERKDSMGKKLHFQAKGMPLIKFQDADKIKSLQSGKIYAKTLGYYRKREEETGDCEVGDKYEAMIHINEGTIYFPDTGETVAVNDDLLKTSESNDFVFCMLGINPTEEKFRFTDKQKEKMLSFGDTALIVLDHDEFIRRVKVAAEKAGYKVYFKPVQYYDPTIDGGKMLISLFDGMWNIAFWKRDSYTYQQEVRFVFTPGDEKIDHIELDIGDISDITEIITAKLALSAIIQKSGSSET